MNKSVAQAVEERLVQVSAGSVTLEGNLSLPKESRAIVLFAHGSGSSRHSPRNRYVARFGRLAYGVSRAKTRWR